MIKLTVCTSNGVTFEIYRTVFVFFDLSSVKLNDSSFLDVSVLAGPEELAGLAGPEEPGSEELAFFLVFRTNLHLESN